MGARSGTGVFAEIPQKIGRIFEECPGLCVIGREQGLETQPRCPAEKDLCPAAIFLRQFAVDGGKLGIDIEKNFLEDPAIERGEVQAEHDQGVDQVCEAGRIRCHGWYLRLQYRESLRVRQLAIILAYL